MVAVSLKKYVCVCVCVCLSVCLPVVRLLSQEGRVLGGRRGDKGGRLGRAKGGIFQATVLEWGAIAFSH